MNLFRLHPENRIGYKKLSDADLGLSTKSHQTHFGLFDDILTFLPNSIDIPDAIFLFEDEHIKVNVSFDRIMNPDGSYRSPKIKKGASSQTSLLSLIRNHAQNASADFEWFLFWFGLENEQPVFFLVRSGSEDYVELLKNGIDLTVRRGRITDSDYQFDSLLRMLETKINLMRISEAKKLELEILSGNVPDFSKYRPKDYDAARLQCAEIGRKGEEIVDQYLSSLVDEGKLKSYTWMNKIAESYYPYDFEYVADVGSEKCFIEVKTTGYSFNQHMIFSGQEIGFGSTNRNCYDIFRIYKSESGQFLMRVCKKVDKLFDSLKDELMLFEDNTIPYAGVQSVKLSVDPENEDLDFGNETRLVYSLD